MFGTVLDKITTLAGRAFIISAIFPMLIFCSANIVMVAALIDNSEKYVESLIPQVAPDAVVTLPTSPPAPTAAVVTTPASTPASTANEAEQKTPSV